MTAWRIFCWGAVKSHRALNKSGVEGTVHVSLKKPFRNSFDRQRHSRGKGDEQQCPEDNFKSCS